MSDPEEGGATSGGNNNNCPPDLVNLQDNFSQQKAKIIALKELVRQSEATQGKNAASAQEKVRNIAQRLSHLKNKSSRSRLGSVDEKLTVDIIKDDVSENVSISGDQLVDDETTQNQHQTTTMTTPSSLSVGGSRIQHTRARSETPGSEKIQLLRKQMEHNRLKMAEREHSKRDIEELVTQLKAKFDNNAMSLEKSSHLARSIGDLSVLGAVPSGGNKYQSASDLSGGFSFDKDRIRYLEKRVRELESEIKNKENEFLNSNAASEHLKTIKNLENKILDYKENLNEKESVIEARTQAISLLSENLSLKGKNTVDLLEDTQQEMYKMQKKFIELEEGYKAEINSLKTNLTVSDGKIKNLEEINDILETTRYDLTLKNSTLEQEIEFANKNNKKLTQLTRLNESLQERITELEIKKSDKNEMEVKFQDQEEALDKQNQQIELLKNNLSEKTVEYNVLNASFSVLQEKLKSAAPKSLFTTSTDEVAEAEIAKLKTQLDEANKSAIKTKVKTKQLLKQIDMLKKSSETNNQILVLTEQNQQLQQRITELESSALPLPTAADILSNTPISSLSDNSELTKRIQVLEQMCQNQVSAINLLEEEKIDITEDLQMTKSELTTLKDHHKLNDDENVKSQMESIVQEEKLDSSLNTINKLQVDIERLTNDKCELSTKLNNYLAENMELLDKLEKLSKGSSSAESIEIVESLTHEEKLEMEEEFQKSLQSRTSNTEDENDTHMISPDLSESLVKLQEESSELMYKIEMFTNERREVLDKMEVLSTENTKLITKINELDMEKLELSTTIENLQTNKLNLDKLLTESNQEKQDLLNNIKEINKNRIELQDEINRLMKTITTQIISSNESTTSDESSQLFLTPFQKEPYIKSLKSLEIQMENYRKTKDRNAKFENSKKLAKEAKNIHEIMTKLITEYEETVGKCIQMQQNYQLQVEAKLSESVLNKSHYVDLETELEYERKEVERQKLLVNEKSNELEELKKYIEICDERMNKEKDEFIEVQRDLQEQLQLFRNDECCIEKIENERKELSIKLEKAIEDHRQQLSNLTESIESLQNENHRLNKEIKQITETQQFDQSAHLSEIERLKSEFENQLTTKQNNIQKLHEEQLTQLRQNNEQRQLATEKEIEILKVLVAEQKAQLIETLTEYQTEIDKKTEEIENLRQEISKKESSSSTNEEYINELNEKMLTLKTLFDDNNDLLEKQAEDLKNKQETINLLNKQIMELYKTLEENNQKLLEKDDELNYVQEILDQNREELKKNLNKLGKLEGENERVSNLLEVKSKEMIDLENKVILVSVPKVDTVVTDEKIIKLETQINELNQKNKDQLDKLKKFAANLKKKTTQFTELEEKYRALELNKNTEDLQKELLELKQNNVQQFEELNLIKHENSRISVSLQQSSIPDTTEIDEANNKIDRLNKLNEELHKKIETLTKQYHESFDAVNIELNEKIEEISEIELTLSQKLQIIDQLTEKLANNEIEFNTISAKLAVVSQDLLNKNLKFEKCKAVIKEKNREIKRLQDSLTEQTIKPSQELFDSQMLTLQTELQNSNAEKLEITQELKEYLKSIDDQQFEITKLKEQLSENEETYKKLRENSERELTDLQQQYQQNQTFLNENNQLLKLNIEKLTSEIQELTEKYETELEQLQQHLFNQQSQPNQIDLLELKLQENHHYIETIELENAQLKEKISKLEEGIGYIEERRSSLERQANLLGTELQEKTNEFEQNEDVLIRRLNDLSSHDELIEQKLKDVDSEKQELLDQLRDAKESQTRLNQQVNHLEGQFLDLQCQLENSEEENTSLITKNFNLQAELKQERVEFEKLLNEKREEVDTLENDLSAQLQKLADERRTLHEDLEKTKDENNEFQHDIVRFKEIITSLEQTNSDLEREMTWIKLQNENIAQDQLEIQELRMQIVHDQTEIENLKSQTQTMLQNHEIELNGFKQQLAELESLRAHIGQNQTDDQMFIQNENERLQALLATKEIEIQNYQQQNLQLQMSNFGGGGTGGIFANQQNDPFAAVGITKPTLSISEQQKEFESETLLLNEKIQHLESQLQQNQSRLTEITSRNEQLVHDLTNKLQIIEENTANQSKLMSQLTLLRLENEELLKTSTKLENELKQKEIIEEPIIIQAEAKISSTEPIPTSSSTMSQPPQQPISDANLQRLVELERTVANLESYITQLQLQLRISTNDCEQMSQQINSMEEEIHNTKRSYELKINKLQSELNRLEMPAQIIDSIESLIDAQPQDTVDKLVATSEHDNNTTKNPVTSFNSSMFFDSSTESDVFNISSNITEPTEVIEEIIISKKAYVCHPESDQLVGNVESNTDEGWAFGSDDAALEEKHQQEQLIANPTFSSRTFSLLPPNHGLEIRIQECEDKILELNLERDRLREENQALQVKSGKMLKKLKEYKTKNDELAITFRKSASVESTSNDLDLAIQEELNMQIKTLESQLKESKIDQEKLSTERQNLLKRVDVLISANDRLTEMKEHQDSEMEMCKNNLRKLTQKLEKLEEWSEDTYNEKSGAVIPAELTTISAVAESSNCEKTIKLIKENDELRSENEEFQTIIDEEKEHSKILEERIKKLQESLILLENVTEGNEKLKLENSTRLKYIAELENQIDDLKLRMNDSISTIDVLSNESEVIKVYLDKVKNEHKNKIDENENLSKELKCLSDKNVELSNEIVRMKDNTDFFNQSSQNTGETIETRALEERIQELEALLQYKEAEISNLTQRVEDVISEDKTPQLVQEILIKNIEINSLRNLVTQLEADKKEIGENFSAELLKKSNRTENPTTVDYQTKFNEYESEKLVMEHELEVLNEQVLKSLKLEDELKDLSFIMDTKNIENAELRRSLEEMQNQQVAISGEVSKQNLEQQQRIQLLEENVQTLNVQWEQRCSELAESWRQHLNQREIEFEAEKLNLLTNNPTVTRQINQNIIESSSEEETLKSKTLVITEETEKDENELTAKMQQALESQELEIVTLKEQLAIRSAEYARIAAQIDPFGQMSTMSNFKKPTDVITTTTTSRNRGNNNNNDTAGNSAGGGGGVGGGGSEHSELDLALYMLHQRDMRCEELTEELISLLGERDTLQLKLSNSIRQFEEFKTKTGVNYASGHSDVDSTDTSPEKNATDINLANNRNLTYKANNKNTNEVHAQLDEKISQLHGVGHSRDKSLREERDQRQRQMALLQKDVSTLPPEAVAELIGANYTLSRQTQSPSSVLLNWLWGKSTPKSSDN